MRAMRIATLGTVKRKDRPPLPRKLPGEFFMLEWDKYRDRFILYVDDEEHSSYDLGGNIQLIMRQFRQLWKLDIVADRAIDMAREFGKAQVILHDGRIIAHYDRTGFEGGLDLEREPNRGVLPKLGHY